ncbi:MAG: DUF362 domain-containing protein [Chitinispirillaceae bacterium]|nr:DUF362 domain-containing protein [Chitinispirillaceae bacterium]
MKKIAAAGVTVASGGLTPARAAAASSSWTNRKAINPAIDNLRVVCCHDPSMITGNYIRNTMAAQNAPVVTSRVQLNLDEMAKALAQKPTAAEAWRTIFQKPSGKEYAATVVAIKINGKTNGGAPNGSPMNNPRIAVIDKICRELGNLGIPLTNITLFDATAVEDLSTLYGSYIGNGIPAGVKVSTRSGAYYAKTGTPTPAPMAGSYQCIRELANGTADILINIGVNKAHSYDHTGLCSLSLKNHLGTFQPQPHDINYLLAINKSDAILGGTPPRQQLCVIDSLWSNMAGGPVAPVDSAPARLIMGVFGPAVDYLTAKRVRETAMGAAIDQAVITRYLTEFGYQTSETANTFINVPPAPVTPVARQDAAGSRAILTVGIPGTGNSRPLRFELEQDAAVFPMVTDLGGRILRELAVSRQSDGSFFAAWDGTTSAGVKASAGRYIISVAQNGRPSTGVVTVR